MLYIVNRDYLVDEEKGVINVFRRFGNSISGMPGSHTLRYVDGTIHAAHTLSVNLGGGPPSPQAKDDGSMARPPAAPGAAPRTLGKRRAFSRHNRVAKLRREEMPKNWQTGEI